MLAGPMLRDRRGREGEGGREGRREGQGQGREGGRKERRRERGREGGREREGEREGGTKERKRGEEEINIARKTSGIEMW